MKINHIYKNLLLEVEKPYRYIGGEPGSLVKTNNTEASIALAFPDVYEIGMSHMGFRILYQKINSISEFVAERVFSPWVDMEQKLRENNLPLVSLETSKPLKEFDFIGFSLQFELNYTNILQILDLAEISLFSTDRSESDPIIIAGGPVSMHAEPVAPFIDIFIPGDGEEIIIDILRLNAKLKKQNFSREQRIKQISTISHCYVPHLYQTYEDPKTGFTIVKKPDNPKLPYPVKPAKVYNFDLQPSPVEGAIAYDSVFERAAVELARGCNQGCRFCQAGFIYRPFTEHSPQYILKAVDQALDLGYSEVSLSALSTLDYTDFEDLLEVVTKKLKNKTASIAISSLRAYGLSDNLLDNLRTGRGGTLTFAPEAGTQRLRNVINKNITEEELTETSIKVAQKGWSRIKLYFMSGLPTETEEDLREIPNLGQRLHFKIKQSIKGKTPKISCSVSNFIPKPHTPFQWFGISSIDEMYHRRNIISDEARNTRIKVRFHGSQESYLEAILAKGDRKVAEVILMAYKQGARFDGWRDLFNFRIWTEAFEKVGLNPEIYTKKLNTEDKLPWEHISTGVSKKFLLKELQKALNVETTQPCLIPKQKSISCNVCGVPCDLIEEKNKKLEAIDFLHNKVKESIQKSDLAQNTNPLTFKILIYYSKTGIGTIFSHLDLIDHFIRILRSAKLDLIYTEGFTPRPKLTFSPALGQFVSGENEILEVVLRKLPENLRTTLALLNQNALPGIEFIKIENTSDLTSLTKRIQAISFKVIIPFENNFEENLAQLKEKIENTEEIFITRKSKKGKIKKFSINKGIKHFNFIKKDETLHIFMDLLNLPTSVVKPSEILDLIEFENKTKAQIIRKGFVLD